MIIDCHGHYTTAPKQHEQWRQAQIEAHSKGARAPERPQITDDEIRDSIRNGQLRVQRERGTDLTIFSPRAAGMGHHLGSAETSESWAIACNDLIYRVCSLFPQNFIGACMLPQSAGTSPKNSIGELERCVREYGFVGCNLNPDPSGGYWTDPPLSDPYWYPIYETLVELDVPAMIHVSHACNPAFHTTGSHYLNGDTTAFVQFLTSDVFARFPKLKIIIPHGGGAVPYHWGRFRGLAQALDLPLPSFRSPPKTSSKSSRATPSACSAVWHPGWILNPGRERWEIADDRIFCTADRASGESGACSEISVTSSRQRQRLHVPIDGWRTAAAAASCGRRVVGPGVHGENAPRR